jgi:hypothetical protein
VSRPGERTTSRGDSHSTDALSLDRYPSCPQCGNICGRLARLCADCGAFLYEPDLTDHVLRDKLHRDSASRAKRREDVTPTEGTEA